MLPSRDLEKLDVFDKSRPRLFGLAYRMLGTRDEAEDILQEAYLRLHSTDLETIENPEAWLVTVTTRLSIDRLRKASVQRETYIGPWLPEPIVLDVADSPEIKAEMASDVSLAFLIMLERLSPSERAIFLLHDVFDFAHAEIARIVARSEASVRQIVSRARARVRTGRPRFNPDQSSYSDLIRKFVAASYAKDERSLISIFADDVALTSDGGGKVHAARRIVTGRDRVLRIYTVAVTKYPVQVEAFLATINGEPGVIEVALGHTVSASTFIIKDGQIAGIYRVMNPDKLIHIRLDDKNNLIAVSQI
jgi:RNA polymerase sigma-70 factor, ECF subfamily